MRSLLRQLLLDNWLRKVISLILALIVMFVVSQSLTATKTISSIPVKMINIPQGKTVDGIQSNGYLSKRITLTLSGNKRALEDLSSSDLEVVIDATNRNGEWIQTITRKNLSSNNPEINLTRIINKVSPKNFIIKLVTLSSAKIPLIITQPIGEAPKGYRFLDVWPYQLYIDIQGPEDILKKLKNRGLKLTFNLNNISKAQLDDLKVSSLQSKSDVVSFLVPNHWKQVSIPALSDVPVEINDPDAKYLRIDFIKSELIPLKRPMQINYFFPPPFSGNINAQKLHIAVNEIIENRNGFKLLDLPLAAKGVSELFLEIVKDMLEIVVIVTPKSEQLSWSVQFVNPIQLENKYVSTLGSDVAEKDISALQPQVREEYLRNRFRNYMQRFQLFTQNGKKLNLSMQLQGNTITITEKESNE